MKIARRVGWWLLGGGVLALVTLSYLDPHLMLDLADQIWACF